MIRSLIRYPECTSCNRNKLSVTWNSGGFPVLIGKGNPRSWVAPPSWEVCFPGYPVFPERRIIYKVSLEFFEEEGRSVRIWCSREHSLQIHYLWPVEQTSTFFCLQRGPSYWSHLEQFTKEIREKVHLKQISFFFFLPSIFRGTRVRGSSRAGPGGIYSMRRIQRRAFPFLIRLDAA